MAQLQRSREALQNRTIWLLEPERQLLVACRMALGGSRAATRAFMKAEDFPRQTDEGRGMHPSLLQVLQLSGALIINSDGAQRHELLVLFFRSGQAQGQQPAAFFHFETG